MRDTRASDWCSNAGTGKEPGLELVQLPVAAQQREQSGGEHHKAIALSFTLAYADDHALGVDIGALQLTEFGDAYARGVEGGEDRPMLEVAGASSNVLTSSRLRMTGSFFGFLG